MAVLQSAVLLFILKRKIQKMKIIYFFLPKCPCHGTCSGHMQKLNKYFNCDFWHGGSVLKN